MILRILLYSLLLITFTSSSKIIPPGVLKKDVKKVCSCYKKFISLEAKNFPKTSPIYQESKLEANTSLLQVESHISEKLYTMEDFNKLVKKKCPDMIKKLQTIALNPADN